MLKALNADGWAAIVVLIFSVAFLIESRKYPLISEMGPGPGFFAFGLSIILLVLAIIYLYQALRGKNVSKESMPTGVALKSILYIVGSIVVFLIIVNFLGFVLTSSIFLFLLLYRGYKWYVNLAISIGTSVILFLFFHTLLGVALPVNGFGW